MGIPLSSEADFVKAIHHFLYKRRLLVDSDMQKGKLDSRIIDQVRSRPYTLRVFIIHDSIRDKDFSIWLKGHIRMLDRTSGEHLIFYTSVGEMDIVMDGRARQNPHYIRALQEWKDHSISDQDKSTNDTAPSSVEAITRRLGVYYDLFEKSPILLISLDKYEVGEKTHYVSCQTNQDLLLDQLDGLGAIADNAYISKKDSNEIYEEIENKLEAIRINILDQAILEAEDMLCVMRFAAGNANRYQETKAIRYISQLESRILGLCKSSSEIDGIYEIDPAIKSTIMDLNIALQGAANTDEADLNGLDLNCYSEDIKREIALSMMAAKGAIRINSIQGAVSFTAPLLGLAVLLEREFNSTAVHYLRAASGVKLPDKYMLFDEDRGEAKLNFPELSKKLREIDFNRQDRNGRRDKNGNILWDPPVISLSKKAFFNFTSLSKEHYPHPKEIYEIRHIINTDMDRDWDNCIELRNLAAHAIRIVDNSMYAQMENFVMSAFNRNGLFNRLDSLKKSLGIE